MASVNIHFSFVLNIQWDGKVLKDIKEEYLVA